MNFLDRIELLISEIDTDIRNIQNTRMDKSYYVNFVTENVNSEIKKLGDVYNNDPVKVLGDAITKVPSIVEKSFENIERVHSNLLVTKRAYEKIKGEFIYFENEKNQATELQKKTEKSFENEKNQVDELHKKLKKEKSKKEDRGIRSIGERPADKLKERKKKSKKKSKKLNES